MDDDKELNALVLPDGVTDDGTHVRIPKALLSKVQKERARRHALTQVPSTPRHIVRDAGGMAVGKQINRWPHATLDMLRDIRESSPILAPVHQARQYQTAKVCVPWVRGKPGIRVVHKNHMKWNAQTPEGFQPWIDKFEALLWSPGPSYGIPTLGSAMSLLMEDLLTVNRPCVEPIHAAWDDHRIVQWRPVDGAIIWPTLLWAEKWKSDHPTWLASYDRGRISPDDAFSIMCHQMQFDLYGAEFVLVREGVAERTYKPGDLILSPLQNRTDIRRAGYPPSHVEQAMRLIGSFLNAFDYNSNFLTKGFMAEIILGLPAEMHPDDVDAFVDMLREATQGVGKAWQPPIIPIPRGMGPNPIQAIPIKSNPTDSGWDSFMQLCAALLTGIYRTHMSTIGMDKWSTGGGSRLGGRNETAEIDLANEEGLCGDLGHLVDTILTPLAERCHPDLRVIFETGTNPKGEAEIFELVSKVATTRNEVRIEQGRRPQGVYLDDDEYAKATPDRQKEHDDNPWNWPTDPGFASAKSQAAQRDMMMQQQAQQPGASTGHDDGFGGDDDGFGGGQGAPPAPFGTPPGGGESPPQGQPKPPGPPQPQPMGKARTYTLHVTDDPSRYP